MEDRLLLEETLVAALEAVEGLSDRVCPIIDIQKSTGPLAVFEQQDESEENAIDGTTGLCVAIYKIYAMDGTYSKMRLLAEKIKKAVTSLRQYEKETLCIEEVVVKMAAPDIYEDRVRLFRRTYQITIHYQIKEEK